LSRLKRGTLADAAAAGFLPSPVNGR